MLLNTDERCEGLYTWERGDQRSAIDLVVVNEYFYSRFMKMEIDEERNMVEFSDHCMISVFFEAKRIQRKLVEEQEERFYYKFTEDIKNCLEKR